MKTITLTEDGITYTKEYSIWVSRENNVVVGDIRIIDNIMHYAFIIDKYLINKNMVKWDVIRMRNLPEAIYQQLYADIKEIIINLQGCNNEKKDTGSLLNE